MQVEESRDYDYPQETCFKAIVDYVIPNFKTSYQVGYSSVKIPNFLVGIKLKIVEAEYQAGFLKAKMQFMSYHLVPAKSSPLIKIYCKVTGRNSCSVEIVAESSAFSDNGVDNFFFNIWYSIPGISQLAKSGIFPKYYFDDVPIYDEKTFQTKNFAKEANKRAFKYIFKKIHRLLDEYLQEKYSPITSETTKEVPQERNSGNINIKNPINWIYQRLLHPKRTVILGSQGSGKTSACEFIKYCKWESDYLPGLVIANKWITINENAALEISYDIGGGNSYWDDWQIFIEQVDPEIIIYLIDGSKDMPQIYTDIGRAFKDIFICYKQELRSLKIFHVWLNFYDVWKNDENKRNKLKPLVKIAFEEQSMRYLGFKSQEIIWEFHETQLAPDGAPWEEILNALEHLGEEVRQIKAQESKNN
jgi:hypothetical protein